MVPKHNIIEKGYIRSFRAVLFRMVPKLKAGTLLAGDGFRAVLFRMVPKLVLFEY